MTEIEKGAIDAVARLNPHVEALVEFADESTAQVRFLESDHFAFMSMCFLSRQIEHARSILSLIPRRDAALIARTMIDGLIQLAWAAAEPQARALQWRLFSWVHDWRITRYEARRGNFVDPLRETRIKEALVLHGDKFLTLKARKAIAAGLPPPEDPYCKSWTAGRRLRDMCAEVEGLDLYNEVYGPMSDWEHWGTGSIGHSLKRDAESMSYVSNSYAIAAQSLAVAFQCLIQTLQLVDAHQTLRLSERIRVMRDEFLNAKNPEASGIK